MTFKQDILLHTQAPWPLRALGLCPVGPFSNPSIHVILLISVLHIKMHISQNNSINLWKQYPSQQSIINNALID